MSGPLVPFEGRVPTLGKDVWVADTARVIGAVTLGDETSVWYGAVLRGDMLAIVIGARTNVQDNAVLHVASDATVDDVLDGSGAPVGLRLGDEVTIGHSAVVHACTVGDRVMIGIGAVVLDGAVIGEDSMVAAGTLVPPGTVVPPGSVVMGRPGKVVRAMGPKDHARIAHATTMYLEYARRFAGR